MSRVSDFGPWKDTRAENGAGTIMGISSHDSVRLEISIFYSHDETERKTISTKLFPIFC